MELTEPQEGVLNIAFRWAEDEREAGDDKMSILDLRDLRSIIDEMGKKASTSLSSKYGHVAPATVGVIQRRLAGAWKSRERTSFSANRRSTSWIS